MFGTLLTLFSSSVITAIITWMVSRQKSKADVDKIRVETEAIKLTNVEKLINIYKNISEELKDELNVVREELHNVTAQMQSLQKENHQLRKEVKLLQSTLQEQAKNN